MPEPEVDALRGMGQVAEDDVVGRQVRILVEKVVFGGPDVLEPGLVSRDDGLQILHDRVVLGHGIYGPSAGGDVILDEEPELHGRPPDSWI